MGIAVKEKIIVIGGTGMLGLPVARKLHEDGFDVTIMTTDPVRTRARVGQDFRLVEGDVTHIESLKPAFEDQDYIYLNLNSRLDEKLYQKIEIDGTANAAKLAAEMGVKRIGCISGASSRGEEKGIIYLDAKVKAERALIESGVPYTIMRPSWFFEGLPNFIQEGKAMVLGKQPIPRGWLAASDYARQVSNAFQKEEAANKCFYNLGPQKMTILEAVTAFCKRVHPELEPMTVSYAMAKMRAAFPGGGRIKAAIGFFQYFEDNPEDVDASEADRILGPNLTTLEEWVETYPRAL